jgi:hypothetical protein
MAKGWMRWPDYRECVVEPSKVKTQDIAEVSESRVRVAKGANLDFSRDSGMRLPVSA